MARKIRKLGQLDTHGVSLVDRGANKKRFAIVKTERDVNITKLLVDVIEKGEMPGDSDEFDKMCKDEGLEGQAAETFKAIVKLAGTYKDHDAMKSALVKALPKFLGMDNTTAKSADLDEEEDEDEDEDDPTMTTTKKSEDGTAVVVAATTVEKTEVQKAEEMSEAVAKAVKAQLEVVTKSQEAIIKSLTEQVAKADSDRRDAQWIMKAEKDLAFVPGQTTEQLAKMLKGLEDKDAAFAETQFQALKAMSLQMQAITKQRGYTGSAQPNSGAVANDAFQAILKAAEPAVAATVNVVKSYDSSKALGVKPVQITKAAEYEAVTAALVADPALYEAYLNEHPEQTNQGPSRR